MAGVNLYTKFTSEDITLLNQFTDILLFEDENGLTCKQFMKKYQQVYNSTIKYTSHGVSNLSELLEKFSFALTFDRDMIQMDRRLREELLKCTRSKQVISTGLLLPIRRSMETNLFTHKKSQTEMTTLDEKGTMTSFEYEKKTDVGSQTDVLGYRMTLCNNESVDAGVGTDPQKSVNGNIECVDAGVGTDPQEIVDETESYNFEESVDNLAQTVSQPDEERPRSGGSLSPVIVENGRFTSEGRVDPEGQTRSSPGRCVQRLQDQESLLETVVDLKRVQELILTEIQNVSCEDLNIVARKLSDIDERLISLKPICSDGKQSALSNATLLKIDSQLTAGLESMQAKFQDQTNSLEKHSSALFSKASSDIGKDICSLSNKLGALNDAINLTQNSRDSTQAALLNRLADLQTSVHSTQEFLKEMNKTVLHISTIAENKAVISSNSVRRSSGAISTTDGFAEESVGPSLFTCRFCRKVPKESVVLDVGCGGLIGCEVCVTLNYTQICPRCKKMENYQTLTLGWQVILQNVGL